MLASGGNNLAICDRCRMSFKRSQLSLDPNAKGLRVCKDCINMFDPYRLPPRQPDPIALAWVRPMVSLVAPKYVLTKDMAVAPVQSPEDIIQATPEDAGIRATGNIPPKYSEFELPNIEYDYPVNQASTREEYVPPRLRNKDY